MPSVYPGPFRGNNRVVSVNAYHVPLAQASGASGIPVVTINTYNEWIVDGVYFQQYNTTTSTAAMPTMGTVANNGLNIDTITGASGKAIEVVMGGNNAASQFAYVAGTSPAFFTRCTFNANTLANVTELYLGFRKVQTFQATMPTGYTDYATIGIHGATGEIELQTQLASGGNVITDTTQSCTAATNYTVQVNVSAAGIVTYLLDVLGNGPLIVPTSVAAYTLGANTVVPYFFYKTVTSHTEVDWVNWTTGLL